MVSAIFHAVLGCFAFGEFFESTMFIEEANFKVEDGFSDYAEAEVPRFNDASVHWSDWYLVDAFACHLFELVLVLAVGFDGCDFAVFEGFEQWMESLGVGFVEEESSCVKCVLELDSKAICDFAFIPTSGGIGFGDGYTFNSA